tara:strand:- start:582 stop:848 length:267 start_codon:yes stop_codon:yes gene_type:complete
MGFWDRIRRRKSDIIFRNHTWHCIGKCGRTGDGFTKESQMGKNNGYAKIWVKEMDDGRSKIRILCRRCARSIGNTQINWDKVKKNWGE